MASNREIAEKIVMDICDGTFSTIDKWTIVESTSPQKLINTIELALYKAKDS